MENFKKRLTENQENNITGGTQIIKAPVFYNKQTGEIYLNLKDAPQNVPIMCKHEYIIVDNWGRPAFHSENQQIIENIFKAIPNIVIND